MNETIEQQLGRILKWSEPKVVDTKYGMKTVRCADPNDAFWELWNHQKDAVKAAGVGVGKKYKDEDNWQVNWWTAPPADLKEKAEANLKQSTSVDAVTDIVIPAPDGLAYRPYQRGAIAFALDKKGVVLADEMGLGKTMEAIGVINADNSIKKVIIVCPVRLKLNWHAELTKWLVRKMVIGIATPTAFPSFADIQIVGYSVVHRFAEFYDKQNYDLAILDEATAIKNRKTQRNAGCKAIKARRRIVISGTPMENNPQEMFELLNFADPVGYGNFFKYVTKYCGAVNSGFGFEYHPTDKDLATLQHKLRSTIMVRRLKADVAGEIPPKTRTIVTMECTDRAIREEMAGWQQFEPQFERIAAAMELAKAAGNDDEFNQLVEAMKRGQSAAFEQMAAVRKRVAEIKLPFVLDMLQDQFIDTGTKVVTFGHHRFMIEAIEEKFGGQQVTHYGGLSEKLAWDRVQQFQNDPRVVIFNGSLLASGMGITLTAASNVLCYEYDWRPGIMVQAEDRCHRIGQSNPVNIHMLVLENSLDAHQVKTYVAKSVVIGKALDGPIGQAEEAAEMPPFTPAKQKPPLSPKKEAIQKLAKELPAEFRPVIHRGLNILAGMDTDHARDLNGVGFSKIDVMVGHSLAQETQLSPGQGALGWMLCRKYRAQLPSDIVRFLGIAPKENNE